MSGRKLVGSGSAAVLDAHPNSPKTTVDLADGLTVLVPPVLPTPFAQLAQGPRYSKTERAIAAGFMDCVARWGVGKTTIEDIARAAGVSRATVYRDFPGGKAAIMAAAWSLDVEEFIARVSERVRAATTLEEALVRGMHTVARHFGQHPALRFIRDHEPAEFEQLVSFERMDLILEASGSSMAPLLQRFLPGQLAHDTSVWVARLLVSYLSQPADYIDMSSEEELRGFVRQFVLPGIALAAETADGSDPTVPSTKTSTNGEPTQLGD